MVFTTHDLGNGLQFLVGELPAELIWTKDVFDEAWRLHPDKKHLIMMHGRWVETPRWQQAYGADYEYTGTVNEALEVPPILQPLQDWVQATIHKQLNGILLNWYEGPDHYIGPHRDSTKNMIVGAPIVTVSFGETRVFRLTLGKKSGKQIRNFPAPNGTVFIEPYATNEVWYHSVPKSTKYIGRRISVTFRAFRRGVLIVTTR